MINQSNKVLNKDITKLVNQTYQYGFSTTIEKDIIEKGLNEKTIYLISQKKQEKCLFILQLGHGNFSLHRAFF